MNLQTIKFRALAAWLLCALSSSQVMADKHMTIGLFGFPPSAGDPYSGTAIPSILTIPAIFDGLTSITKAGEVLPALAVSWARESDTQWVFNLRPNVRFSNGEPFKCGGRRFCI